MKRLLRAAFVATTAFVVGSADNRTSGYVTSDGVNVDGVQQNKILFLDGLRGIAILMVVIWHAYGSAYAEYLPYGDQYNVIPIRFFGFGVHLFFIISGFVILMTLERCSTLLDFALRRWLRLFPAMLVASVIILAFDLAFSLGPHGQRTWINLVPGLLFISPSLIHTVTGTMIDSMDGPFWSIYVEVCFYAIFGIVYFTCGTRKAIVTIFTLFLITYASNVVAVLGIGGSLFARSAAALSWLGLIEFGWFTTGALLYEYFRKREPAFLILAAVTGVLSALTTGPLSGPLKYDAEQRIAAIAVVGTAVAAIISPWFQSKLASRFLIFFGFVSYPLYLLHNNIMIGLTKLFGGVSSVPLFLLPIFPITLIVATSWIIAYYIEPNFRALRHPILRSINFLTRTAIEPDASQ